MLYHVIRVLLGAAVVTVGTVLLTPSLSPEVHEMMKSLSKEMYDVSPFVDMFDLTIDQLLLICGVTWIVCGGLILLAPQPLVNLGYLLIAIDSAIGIYCHVKLDHKAKTCAPTAILLFVTLFQLFKRRTNVKEHYE